MADLADSANPLIMGMTVAGRTPLWKQMLKVGGALSLVGAVVCLMPQVSRITQPVSHLAGMPTACGAYTFCAGLQGECCPNPGGAMLSCCAYGMKPLPTPAPTPPPPTAPPTLAPTGSPTFEVAHYDRPPTDWSNYWSTGKCQRHTGGTCNIWGCGSFRGATTCEYWSSQWAPSQTGYKCICQTGYCADMDGRCYKDANHVHVAGPVALRSALKPDQHMYYRGWDLFMMNDEPTPRGLWDVWAMPEFGHNAYMITNVENPEYAIVMTSSGKKMMAHLTYPTNDPVMSMYQVDFQPSAKVSRRYHMEQYVIISSLKLETIFNTNGHNVDTTANIEDDDIWFFDPPLPASMSLKKMPRVQEHPDS